MLTPCRLVYWQEEYVHAAVRNLCNETDGRPGSGGNLQDSMFVLSNFIIVIAC